MSTQPFRLRPDKSLTVFEIAGSTIAQMAPAFSFYFGFAVIAGASGIGAPFTVLIAAIATAIVGISLANFARVHPSSGSLITFLSAAFGGVVGTTSAIVFTVGSIILLGAVAQVIGGWVSLSLQLFYGIDISWIPLTIIFVVIAWLLNIVGVSRSTRVATAAMIIEVALLVLVSLLVLIRPPAPLSIQPFLPSSVSNGLSGFGQGFPLAIFLFIGFENSIALAEETHAPKRNIPRAVLSSIGLMGVLYLFVSYATVEGFGGNINALVQSQIPFITLAQRYLGGFAVLAALAGFTSTAGTILAGSNNFSRVIFHSARAGLFPRSLASVSGRFGTPIVALTIPAALGLILALVVGPLSGGWLNGFGYLSTLGTIPLIIIYGAANVAVLRYKWTNLSPFQRYVLPILGVISLAVPLWALIQPGQPAPYSWFPWLALGLIVLALIYAFLRVRAVPDLSERISAISIDQPELTPELARDPLLEAEPPLA